MFLTHLQVLIGAINFEAAQGGISKLAVESFFIVSGYLVFMSFENSRSVGEYLSKRLRRIYPGYATVIVLFALLGSLISRLPIREYFSYEWIKYLFSNLILLNFLHPSLPGVFENNRLNLINASLWTIKIEFTFYLIVPLVAGLARKLGRLPVLITLYCLSFAYAYICNHLAEKTGLRLYEELGRQLPAQIMFFMAGASLYYFDAIRKFGPWLVGISVLYLIVFIGKAPTFFMRPALA